MPDAKKNVVVIGGGIAGSTVAQQLSRKLNPAQHTLTLIDARPFHIWLPATPRMAVSAGDRFEEKILVPFDHIFDRGIGDVRLGRAVAIDEYKPGAGGHVVLKDGDRVPYDALVLTSGTAWDGPLAYPNSTKGTLQHILDWRTKFQDAHEIVLGGGGPVNIGLYHCSWRRLCSAP